MKPALVIMAAGLGSRYGGCKQIEAVGPNGELIIDYSIYDAVRAGFGKLVFVIRCDFEDSLKARFAGRFEGVIETAYVYQELECCLDGFALLQGREKPWGTGHAVLVTRDIINGPFAVINADDCYGQNSFKMMTEFLSASQDSGSDDYAMVGYKLANSLSQYGAVCRAVCECDKKMFLKGIVERTKIEKQGRQIFYIDRAGEKQFLRGDEIVSTNFWGFGQSVFEHLQSQFGDFLANFGSDSKVEFFLPTAIGNLIEEKKVRVKVLPTDQPCFGVTYRKDNAVAAAKINELIEQGVYPKKLWE